jgi:hypothetical protein
VPCTIPPPLTVPLEEIPIRPPATYTVPRSPELEQRCGRRSRSLPSPIRSPEPVPLPDPMKVAPVGVVKEGAEVIVAASWVDGVADVVAVADTREGSLEVGEGSMSVDVDPGLVPEDGLTEVIADTPPSLEVVFGNVSNHPDPENSPQPAKL